MEFIARLQEELRLERALLFGSRARDDWLHESDYDFVIVSPDFAQVPFLKRASLVQRHWPGREHAEILAYTPDEFRIKAGQICIVQEAVREGVDLLA